MPAASRLRSCKSRSVRCPPACAAIPPRCCRSACRRPRVVVGRTSAASRASAWLSRTRTTRRADLPDPDLAEAGFLSRSWTIFGKVLGNPHRPLLEQANLAEIQFRSGPPGHNPATMLVGRGVSRLRARQGLVSTVDRRANARFDPALVRGHLASPSELYDVEVRIGVAREPARRST